MCSVPEIDFLPMFSWLFGHRLSAEGSIADLLDRFIVIMRATAAWKSVKREPRVVARPVAPTRAQILLRVYCPDDAGLLENLRIL